MEDIYQQKFCFAENILNGGHSALRTFFCTVYADNIFMWMALYVENIYMQGIFKGKGHFAKEIYMQRTLIDMKNGGMGAY